MRRKENFWGLLFILAAVLILLGQFGFLDHVNAFSIVATVFLGGIMIKSLIHLNFWGIFFPAAIICTIFAEQLKLENFTPWPALFTAFCLSVGLSLIFKKSHMFDWHAHHDSSFAKNVINHHDDNVIKCSTSFGECIKYVNSDDFQNAEIKCSFGSTKVYFDHAQIPSGKADIYLDVSFGDAQLYIPRDWSIINDVHVFLGDTSANSRNISPDAPVVTIHGNVSFGDVKIIYV